MSETYWSDWIINTTKTKQNQATFCLLETMADTDVSLSFFFLDTFPYRN